MSSNEKMPETLDIVRMLIDGGPWHVSNFSRGGYSGGFGASCYGCPFASEPTDSQGNAVPFSEIANNPAESHNRCSMPGRDNNKVFWGEDAPCTKDEWFKIIESNASSLGREARALADAIESAPGFSNSSTDFDGKITYLYGQVLEDSLCSKLVAFLRSIPVRATDAGEQR